MIRALLLLAGVASATPLPASAAAQAPRPFDVLHYDARLTPQWRERGVSGHEVVTLRIARAGTQALQFDCGALVIDAVRADGQVLSFAREGGQLTVQLPRPARAGERWRLQFDYHGVPRHGLEFHPEQQQLYTVFSTSQWLVAVDAPEERATLDLAVALPNALTAVGSGDERTPIALDADTTLHRWRLRTPMPSYVYGFAAGPFVQVRERDHGYTLRYLAADADAAALRRDFADTGDMLRFFARRAGVAYRPGAYAQVRVVDTIGQELAGLSLLPTPASDAPASDALDTIGLQAHEAAHQWWGNRITCVDWNHFWLNEGLATFMAAAYLEQRFGREAYDARVERWRLRVERLRNEGKDKPLVFADWTHPSGDDRAVVYQKGAYFLHALRTRMGETAFWRGLRDYSRANIDASVRTRDFQRAMQRHSRVDLAPLFAQWGAAE